MTGLGPLDSGFMELEDTDRHVSAGIGAVAIVAGPPPTRAEFTAMLAERSGRDPRLRQRVQRAPWDIAAPVWVDDSSFDIGHHLRWMALPEPADEAALCELIAVVMEERFDRDHPLWQCVVIEHLAGGRWAVVVKAHHSMVDGISGITMFERLCDESVDLAATSAPTKDSPTDWRRLLVRGLRLPIDLPRTALATVRAAVPLILDVVLPAPDSSLNGPIGRQRRYAVAKTSLPEVREIRTTFGVTINDVALAAVASAFRTVLLGRGEEPRADKLRVLAPVSMRASGAKNILDNRVSAMLPLLPVELTHPVEQLAAVHTRLSRHKVRGEAGAANSFLGLADRLPFAPVALALRLVTMYPQHSVSVLATNVPGPKHRLHLHGGEVLEIFAYAPIAMRLRTGITVLSYGDQLVFGITGDYDSTPDIDLIASGIEKAVAELLRHARQDPDAASRYLSIVAEGVPEGR
ncbi:wax ester/triacylglycerol synthase family O-acyltransferase [Nocardia noduli]|uniref:wax ester/triacylglycerol synthase family O-acyltransferase n=1 Tax=Nocardia noduli TaxID=2815722 RepID=UPI001C21FA87|nr:wax ester/triacylglycerol synthase family O-acyltransferase [Nocardia noduli]